MPRIARILLWTAGAICLAAMVIYGGDVAVWQLRGAPNGSVVVKPYLAVPRKDGRTEFIYQDPREQACASAIFQHGGAPPCWYLRRHTEQRINL